MTNYSAFNGASGKWSAGTGNAVFSSRFFVQWYATEKKRVVVPVAFWWLSLLGSLLLLAYAFRKTDSVFIYAYLFPCIPYT